MTYNEYQIAASRTCVTLATTELDARHMRMGVMSEIGELVDAYKKELAYGKTIDLINIGEEWADVAWYLGNEANRLGITLIEIADFTVHFHKDFDIEHCLLGFMSEFVTSQHDYPDYTKEDLEIITLNMFNCWVYIGKEILKIDTNKALENNIAKLKARYPNSFTQEAALNRNLDAERKELEK